MKILALELSAPQGSIAWHEGESVRADVSFANDRQDSGAFFENLGAFLDRFGNPERIVVGLGPGSYAGTRIAIATATGLAAATGASLCGLPSICAMATEADEYGVIGDARRQTFFCAHVRARECVDGPHLMSEEELREKLKTCAWPVLTTAPLAAFPEAKVVQPEARILAGIVPAMTAPLEPIYLRAPHITQPKAGRAPVAS